MWFLLLACSDPPPPPPEPTPEPVPEPVQEKDENGMPIQRFSVPVGHCHASERVRFSCNVGGGKVVSLCESGDGLSYRFGKPKRVELELPAPDAAAGATPFEISRRVLGEDSELHIASVWNDRFRYAIRSERVEDTFEGGLVVRDMATPVSTLPCMGEPTVDFTEITGRFEGSFEDPRAWVGAWKGEDVEASITLGPPPPDPDAKKPKPKPGTEPAPPEDPFAVLALTGEATWRGGMDVVHTGEASGTLQRDGRDLKLAPDAEEPDANPCAITLRRMVANTIYVEDNGRCGGMNVTFTGTYHREP